MTQTPKRDEWWNSSFASSIGEGILILCICLGIGSCMYLGDTKQECKCHEKVSQKND